MRLLAIVFALCSTPWNPLHAMQWEELKPVITQPAAEVSNDDAEAHQRLMQRLNDIIVMTVVYTRQLREAYPDGLLFCPPRDQPFHLPDLLTLISDQARFSQAEPAIPVQQLLLDGLRRQFPCPGP